jgi:hypothetical protein
MSLILTKSQVSVMKNYTVPTGFMTLFCDFKGLIIHVASVIIWVKLRSTVHRPTYPNPGTIKRFMCLMLRTKKSRECEHSEM